MFVCVCFEAVSANSEKIGAEELQCKAMADNAQRDLDEALPALEEAMKVDLCTVVLPSVCRSICLLLYMHTFFIIMSS